jgi:hypothetical protein
MQPRLPFALGPHPGLVLWLKTTIAVCPLTAPKKIVSASDNVPILSARCAEVLNTVDAFTAVQFWPAIRYLT